jgi:hypothetical protein
MFDATPTRERFETLAHFTFTEHVAITMTHTTFEDSDVINPEASITIKENRLPSEGGFGGRRWLIVTDGPVTDLIKEHFKTSEAYAKHMKQFENYVKS